LCAWTAASAGGVPGIFDPPALYLTWQRDPTTTMTIHWQTVDEAKTELYFRAAATTNAWKAVAGNSHPLPGSVRKVHTVELTGLLPATDYNFCFWPGERVFKFRTMPKDLSRPVRFIDGGDVYSDRTVLDAMNELAGKLDPSFVVFGGDLAYSCGGDKPEKMERWEAYFDSWKQKARTPDGRLVPMLVAIGNHEVPPLGNQPAEKVAAFYSLFSMPGPQGYNVLDFGRYLSLFLLNTAHTQPIEGAQTKWLQHTLAERRRVPHLVPTYHVPAYPSYRPDDTGGSATLTKKIRDQWCPLFERYGVKIAFEHHDHTFKRTLPIRAGKVDPKGVVYLGDGAWAVTPRKPDAKPRWYLAKTASVRHFHLVTLYSDARHVLSVNEHGQVFDEVYQRTR
jgi:hypothetical protein